MTRTGRLAASFVLYVLAAIILLQHRGLLNGTAYVGHGTDPSLYVWMFRFLPDAIAHFRNPLILGPAWAPHGLNITQATTTPGLALLAWPITALSGPVVAFNIVSVAAPALAATTAFLFASAYTSRWGAAFVAGWIFGFSTYVFAALLGHLQVAFTAFVPLAFLAVTLRARNRLSVRSYIGLLTATFVLQFLTSLEIFVTEAIFLGLFAVMAEATRTGGIRRLYRLDPDNLLVGLAVAYTITAIIVSPMIIAFFRNYSRIPHSFQNGGYWSIDLLGFVIPTPVTWIGGHLALPLARRFTGNWSEDLGYVGAPILLIVALAAFSLRSERRAWPLVALLAGGLICALGPRLHVLGHMKFHLPWALIEKLPLLHNAEPARLMVFPLLAMSGLAALWIEKIESRRLLAVGALVAATVFTLPSTLVHAKGWWNAPVPTARLFATGRYRKLIDRGDTVLFLPFTAANGDALFWQAETAGYFRITNGYGSFVPPDLAIWPAARMLEGGLPAPGFAAAFDQFAKAMNIGHVIVPPALLPVWGAALREAGWTGQKTGRLTVFDWPAAARAAVVVHPAAAANYAFDVAHLRALHEAAACLLARGAAQIDPATAVAAGCLDPAFGATKRHSHSNWDRMGGWLGRFGNGIGVGLNTVGANAARLAAAAGPGAGRIYYPYPRIYHPGAKPAPRGEYLEERSLKAFPARSRPPEAGP